VRSASWAPLQAKFRCVIEAAPGRGDRAGPVAPGIGIPDPVPGAARPADAPWDHLATSAIVASGPEDVIVIANNGRTGVSCWGDILTVAAQQRGIRGTVIDGACRDVDAIADAGYPVWARAGVPVTARGRIAERATDVPVSFGGICVLPGDFVIADGSGVVFVPDARAGEVLAAAERLANRQERMVEAVRAGRSVVDVMHDTQFTSALKGDRS
jgi:regulator of RNase E activity RraA